MLTVSVGCGAGSSSSNGGNTSCTTGTLCQGSCVDTSTDVANCGGCAVQCAGACSAGKCVTETTTFTSVDPLPIPSSQAQPGIVSGAPSIVEDQMPGAAGDLLLPVFDGSGYWYLYASQDGGQTWSYIQGPSPSVGTHTGGICQDTVHYMLHMVTNSSADENLYYSRLNLTRNSGGHVTGWTWDVESVLVANAPNSDDGDPTDVRFQIVEAVDGLGENVLVLAYLYSPVTLSSTLAMLKTTEAAGVVPTATADFVGLGGSGSETVVDTTPVDSTCSYWNIHDLLIGLAQHPVTHTLYVFRGPAGDPAACLGSANQESVVAWEYAADSSDSGFTLASSASGLVLSQGTSSQVAHWGGTFPTEESIWIAFVSPTGPEFDRVASDGSYHANVLPNPDPTGSIAGYLSMAVNADETGAWATWVGTGDQYDDTWSGHWNGSSWDHVEQVSSLDMSGFGSSLYWRGGLAVVERSDEGYIESPAPDSTYQGQIQVIRTSH